MVSLRNQWQPESERALGRGRALAPADVMFTVRKRPQTIDAAPAYGHLARAIADYCQDAGIRVAAARRCPADAGQSRECGVWRVGCASSPSREGGYCARPETTASTVSKVAPISP